MKNNKDVWCYICDQVCERRISYTNNLA